MLMSSPLKVRREGGREEGGREGWREGGKNKEKK